MEKVFLSYTYRPHPEHEANLERLRRYVVRTIEAMGLRIVDGVDVGGRPLDDALRKNIKDADALIALVTPQADDAGNVVAPTFVLSEFKYAERQEKPTMRVWHNVLVRSKSKMPTKYITGSALQTKFCLARNRAGRNTSKRTACAQQGPLHPL
jgi:hypothetical protein